MGIAFFNDSPKAAKSHVVRGILARVERAPPPIAYSQPRRSKNRHVQDNRRKEFSGSFRFTRSPPSPPALSGLSVWISWSRFIPPGADHSPRVATSVYCKNARARINLLGLLIFCAQLAHFRTDQVFVPTHAGAVGEPFAAIEKAAFQNIDV